MKINNTIKYILGFLLVVTLLYFIFLSYFKIDSKDVIDLSVGITYTSLNKEASELEKNNQNNLKYSHSFWIYINSLPQNNYMILNHPDTSDDMGFTVMLNDHSKLTVESKIDNNSVTRITYDNILLQKWNHIVIVQDINTMDLYIDGILVQTHENLNGDTNARPNINSRIDIGNKVTNESNWVGDSTLLKFYKYYAKALTQNEIKSIYNNYAHILKNQADNVTMELDIIQNSSTMGSIVI